MLSADQTLSPTTVGVGNSGERLSKREFAQRIRREREREIKTSKQIPVVGLSKAQLAQRVRRQREREREIEATHSSMNKQAAAQCTRSGSEKNGVMPQVVPNNALGNMINRFKRAAAEHARRDMDKRARIGLQTPSSVSSNVPSVVKSHRIQSFGDQASVNVEAANVIGKSLANGSVTEVSKKRDKEIVDPVTKAPMVSPLPTTTRYTKVYISKSVRAQRARRERERQAGAHLQMPSSITSNGQLGCLPPSTHVVHPNPIQHSDDQVASNPEIAKVIGINLATPPVADPNQKQGDKENNASIVETSRLCPIPAKSLGVKVCPSKRTLAQRARREQERQARAGMHTSSSILRDAAAETSKHPCPIHPSNPQVTSNVEVDSMAVENSANRVEPKPTEGDIQIISPLFNTPLADTLISKKINTSNRSISQRARREREKQYLLHSQAPSQILHSQAPSQIFRSNRATSQRARREREKQYRLHSQVPSQISSIERLNRATSQRARREREKQYLLHSLVPYQFSSNERSTRFSARECSNNPYPIKASDDQVTINVEVAKVVGENLTNGSELKQTEGNTETISPLAKAPAASSCKKIYISRRKAAQRARRAKEKQDRLHSQLPSQISNNEKPAFFPAKECSNNPCPIQPSDAQVTIYVGVAKVVGENLTNGSELRQTEGNTKTISPLAKAPMVSSVPAASSCKKYISKRKAAQRARREKEKQDRLHSQLPSKIPSNEQPALFKAKECSNNPCPVQPSDTQVTINVEVAKVVGENSANRAEPKQTEGDTDIISPLQKAPMVSPLPAASSSKEINISKRTSAQRARSEREKQYLLQSQVPSSSSERSTFFPVPECSNNPCQNQPSDDQVTFNVEVAKVVGENSAIRAEPKQTEGDTDIVSPLVKAPMVSPLTAASSSKEKNISKRIAAQRARWEGEKQYLFQSQVPLKIYSNERSTFSPATKCSNNTCPIQPSDTQGTVNAEVAGEINENLVNLSFKDPKQMQGHKEVISPLVKAPIVTPVSDAFFREVINTSKRAATNHARKDKKKLARVELQVPSSASSEKQSVSFTERSENRCSTQPSNGQATVNLEVSKVGGDDLAERPCPQPMQEKGVKEIMSPTLEALRARVASKLLSYSLSDKKRASMRGTEYIEHTPFVQVSSDQVNVNLEGAKVATENSANRQFTEPKQKEGDKELVSPLWDIRIPRPWLQQRPILLTTVASSAQVRPSLHASSHQLISSSPKQSFDSVPASSHQLRSLPPKQSFASVRASGHQFRSLLPEQRFASVRASVSSLPPKQSVTPVHASGPKVCAFPPEQKSVSHHKPTKWSVVPSSPVRTTGQKLPIQKKPPTRS